MIFGYVSEHVYLNELNVGKKPSLADFNGLLKGDKA